jgi:hypothetical protein
MRCLTYLTLVAILAVPAGSRGNDDPNTKSDLALNGARFPDSTVSYALRDFWLRFHEMELCQYMRATFDFHGDRMEVWCQPEDEKAFQRFTPCVFPIRSSCIGLKDL